MIKLFFVLLTLISSLLSAPIMPTKVIKTSGSIVDLSLGNKTLWAANSEGFAVAYSLTGKEIEKLSLPKKTDAWGEQSRQKAMSISLASDGSLLAVASEDGRVFIRQGSTLKATSFATRSIIKKILALPNNKVAIALLSNEIIYFDTKTNKSLWTLTAGTSPLSDMALFDSTHIAVAGEAGVVTIIDLTKGVIVGRFQGGNVDNIYKLDIQKGITLTAGQDRRAILYNPQGKITGRINGSFLIYAAALSPQATTAAIALDEQNRLTLFTTATLKQIGLTIPHGGTLNRILFTDERHFVSSADENKLYFWELP